MNKDDEGKEPQLMDISALEIDHILSFFISILNTKAWQYMGLRVDPKTQKISSDFEKARLSIDCISFIIDKITPSLREEEVGKLRSILADLQINYIRQKDTTQE